MRGLNFFILLFLLGSSITFFTCKSDTSSNGNDSTNMSSPSVNGALFDLVSSKKTSISFANNLTEDLEQNYLNFEYIYNGGGVAAGDINNDGLPDLYFSGNEVPNKLYLNKGDFKFEDVTEKAGVSGGKGWHTGVSMVDINSDGWLDIYVCKSDWHKKGEYDRRNLLYINKGDGTFEEMGKSYQLAENGYSIQASFFDYDNDGDLDVYITNHPMEFGSPIKDRDKKAANPPQTVRDKLYRNNGDQTFSEVAKESGIINYSHGLGVVTADINKDGWVDVYVTNDYDEPDFMYINQKNGTFKESIKNYTGHISLFAMGVDIGDINNDGLEDILTTEMLPNDYKRSKTNMASMNPEKFHRNINRGLHYQYMHNSLQLNRGNYFSEIAQLSGISKTDWSWACLLSDFDNDGFKDVFIANGYKRDVFDKDFAVKSANIIAKNNGVVPLNDIYEIMPTTKLQNFIYKNNGDLTFTQQNGNWGLLEKTLTQGAAVVDLDNDGDLDLVLNNLDEKAMVYRNNASEKGNNYLRVQLEGGELNKNALGAKVTLKQGDQVQYQEMKMVRGYNSSMEPILHFGVGKHTSIDEVEVVWLNGKVSRKKAVATNQLLTISQTDNIEEYRPASMENPLFVENAQKLLMPPFVHKENKFDDYKVQVLLPHKLSQLGPFTAVGDVNKDGKEDFYIGGAVGQAGSLYMQNNNGFKKKEVSIFETDKGYEDGDAIFFDADDDGDQDLYVVSGGTEAPAKDVFYQDRLYLNNKGNFTKSKNLPQILASGSCVIANDFDKDGDQDLFVGGRVIPNFYPYSTQSYLFRNDGGTFTDIAPAMSRQMALQGMVTSAVWTDFDQDGFDDLITVGEWTPIRFFKNQNGTFIDVTQKYNMQNTVGWWNRIVAADYDNDGDEDYIIGNLGLNYKFHASPEKPFHIYGKDFDQNQTIDIVLAKHNGDIKVPVRGRECSAEQMPFVASKFPTFNAFADASIEDILGDGLNGAVHHVATIFESVILENQGGAFVIKPLPMEAQFSTVNGIVVNDFDNDNIQDILLAGNMYGSEPETTRADASIGLLLKGNKDKTFKNVSAEESGLFLPYDVKELTMIKIGKDQGVLATCNDGLLRFFVPTDSKINNR